MDKVQLNIGHNTDMLALSDAVANFTAIQDGYIYPIDDLHFTPENQELFMNTVIETYGELKTYDFTESARSIYKQVVSDEFILYVSGNNKNMYVSAMCKSLDVSHDIYKIYKKFSTSENDIRINMTTYFYQNGHVSSTDKTLAKDEINSISTLYYPYIDTDMMFKQFFTLQENILILTGAPGIGKSKMASAILKYAADNETFLPHDKVKEHESESQYVSVAYVKSNRVLADDVFWRELEMGSYDFVIMDDLDYFLTKREAEVSNSEEDAKNQFLNQFLSYTDGIEKNKTKFIITTNQPFDDIDIALLRKGRLFNILELRSLKFDEALAIWLDNDLSEHDFNVTFSGEFILPADLGSEISKRTNNRIEGNIGNYLKEEGISKIDIAKQVQKVGL